ncbi:MAG: hypothetical protein MRJ65_15460 [Candidatus Brocadiaceae bacterium]|nr:hypothetical protein [Candidatus Brocadiaceae bacterium]
MEERAMKVTTIGEQLSELFADLPSKEQLRSMPISTAVQLTNKMKAFDERIETYKGWYEREKAKVESQKDSIKTLLKPFMLEFYQKTQNKTLRLPNSCVLRLRKSSDSLSIDDEKEAIRWALIHNRQMTKTTVTLLKLEILKHMKICGELPPGVSVKAGEGLYFSITLP